MKKMLLTIMLAALGTSAHAVVTLTPTCTITPSVTPSFTNSPAWTFTDTPTKTSTPTNTVTPSVTPSITPTFSDTSTVTPTDTPTITPSVTPSATPSFSASPTFTRTVTATRTSTSTPTSTITKTVTPTGTPTFSFSPTASDTPTSSPTVTPGHMVVSSNIQYTDDIRPAFCTDFNLPTSTSWTSFNPGCLVQPCIVDLAVPSTAAYTMTYHRSLVATTPTVNGADLLPGGSKTISVRPGEKVWYKMGAASTISATAQGCTN